MLVFEPTCVHIFWGQTGHGPESEPVFASDDAKTAQASSEPFPCAPLSRRRRFRATGGPGDGFVVITQTLVAPAIRFLGFLAF